VEVGYRVRVNGWAFIQPYAQYLVQPNGTAAVPDAAILGAFVGVDF
jgi:carbohydrate-selective porin OprB